MWALTWILFHRWMWMQVFHTHEPCIYFPTQLQDQTINILSNKAACLIYIWQILDHKWQKNARASHVTAWCFHFACLPFQSFSYKDDTMSHARKKKKSLFPACDNLLPYKIKWIVSFQHFLINEQKRESLFCPLICLFGGEPCSCCNLKYKSKEMQCEFWPVWYEIRDQQLLYYVSCLKL